MAVHAEDFTIETKGAVHIIDISDKVADIVRSSGLDDGVVCVFVPGSTGALTTIEYEPGLLKDIPRALEIIAPRNADYAHHMTWKDDNGSSHVRAAFLGPSLTIPFRKGELVLGTWQQAVFVELDTRSRRRSLMCQVIGE
jgi:secondary thiamine-phosphate synthase enzyme